MFNRKERKVKMDQPQQVSLNQLKAKSKLELKALKADVYDDKVRYEAMIAKAKEGLGILTNLIAEKQKKEADDKIKADALKKNEKETKGDKK